jgi:hypothetical protein
MPGPLAARWRLLRLEPPRAGALGGVEVEVENTGTAVWRAGINAAYHWLDERGNPIVWDGLRTPLPSQVAPGEHLGLRLRLRAPIPPGSYRLAVDLVDEGRLWFAEAGSEPLELEANVGPRIARRLAARSGDPEALAAQEEPLVSEEEAEAVAVLAPGVAPAPDWSRRVLDAHQEGYAVVAGSLELDTGPLRRPPKALAPYAPGPGRVPHFPHPLVCPSHVRYLVPEMAPPVEGLPAVHAPADEPWVYDGRIRARLRSGRPRG